MTRLAASLALAAGFALAIGGANGRSFAFGENGMIAFTRFDPGGSRILGIAPNSRTTRALFEHRGSNGDPAWSRDGKRLAYASFVSGGRLQGLFVVAPRGTPRRLTIHPYDPDTPVADGQPQWSPDGRRIVFHRSRGDKFELYVIGSARRSHPRRLGEGFDPAWSPDGRRIAFAHRSSVSDDFDIYIMNANGSGRRRITGTTMNEIGPDWSPDGRRIAFVRSSSFQEYDIYVMRADGTRQVRLTRTARADVDPAWSPDGRRIAFASRRFGRSDVFVMNADGTSQRRLTRNPLDEAQPSWQALPRRR